LLLIEPKLFLDKASSGSPRSKQQREQEPPDQQEGPREPRGQARRPRTEREQHGENSDRPNPHRRGRGTETPIEKKALSLGGTRDRTGRIKRRPRRKGFTRLRNEPRKQKTSRGGIKRDRTTQRPHSGQVHPRKRQASKKGRRDVKETRATRFTKGLHRENTDRTQRPPNQSHRR
jgi:hypothetical protein